MIYFMSICNTGVLLVSNGKILCDLICVCSDDLHEYGGIPDQNIRLIYIYIYIIESVDSISRDEQDVPLTQYITNA